MPGRPRWNHNIHYHRIILDAVPAGATTALDVGTGDGLLAADLRRVVPQVTGIDVDDGVLARARAEHPDVTFVRGDVMAYPFEGEFDVVASVATVHHLPDLGAALRRMRDLTAPGGALVVVGLARATRPLDHAVGLVGVVQHRYLAWRRGYWEHTAPVADSTHSYDEVRRCAEDVLPGVRWRLLPLWRYALVWRRPA